MKRSLLYSLALLALASCKDEKKADTEIPAPVQETTVSAPPAGPEALMFRPEVYSKKSSICNKECTSVSIKVPGAVKGAPGVAESINREMFRIARDIVYFGEKPTNAASYKELAEAFIKSYDDLAKQDPVEAEVPWEARVTATIAYQSENIINIRVNNYMFTGGAHGYEGNQSTLFSTQTGKKLKRSDVIADEKAFTAFAEKKFRQKFRIPAGKPINSTGLMFTNNRFALPENIFFSKDGLLLSYNPEEIASFADGPKEVVIPYSEADKFLKVK